MAFVLHLACSSCEATYPLCATHHCTACGAPLDPSYDWDKISASVDRDALHGRPRTIWRYHELLPLDSPPTVSTNVGWTPLIEAPTLANKLGVGKLWLKCDGYSYPSLSFKDRVVAVSINKAIELGIEIVGCPSTGNLANAVAAHAAAAGMKSWIFIPDAIEVAKTLGTAVCRPNLVRVKGNYDEINRLCGEASQRFGWGMVNINLRPFYSEGSKTMSYEIAEQLGWRTPDAVVCPMAGGSLVTKLKQGFDELSLLGWTDQVPPRIYGAQASGCSPIVTAFLNATDIVPVQPDTIARSIAIGNPADGARAVNALKSSGGTAISVTDRALVEAIETLARHTGIFTETAGGVTVCAAQQLASEKQLTKDDEVVLCLTGNGMKTVEAVQETVALGKVIGPELSQLEALV